MEARWPGIIWGYDIVDGRPIPPIGDVPRAGALRWLHVNLADQRALSWIAALDTLPPLVREVLLTTDEHPRALIDDSGIVACVLHDHGRDFARDEEDVIRTLHFALTPDLMLTARHHPVKCADEIKRRLNGAPPRDAAGALDLLIGTVITDMGRRLTDLAVTARAMEDALLERDHEPDGRALRLLRRRAVRVHRQATGLHGTLDRLEEDDALPAPLLPPVERLIQRVAGIGAELNGLIGQERLLREEITALAGNRVNQNLYVLSIMTALMLPATLVTGLFGMNTGGLPWATATHGTLLATLLAIGSAAATYAILRKMGLMRR